MCRCKLTMSQQDLQTYLKYRTLEDMLKVIVYSAQSALGLTPMLYHIVQNSREVLFIQTGTIGGIIVHFVIQEQKPKEKFIQLKRFTGEFSFVDSIGSDSGAGAGIQADLKTFTSLGVYGCTAITAVTAQNTQEVSSIFEVTPESIAKQIRSVILDIAPDAIKIGMVYNKTNIQTLSRL